MPKPKPHIRVVNMIPKSLSGETNQDSEPQITVNPENVKMILGTAFTPDPAHGPNCPVYASFDSGNTFTLDLVIPGAGGFLWDTFDQSLRFGGGSALYAGILRGDGTNPMNILRSAPYSGSTVMDVLVSRNSIDQPYVAALQAEGKDRVFVGNNDDSSGPWLGSMEHSSDARNAAPPAGFTQSLMDPRVTIRDSPSIRPTIHRDGTVYAGYFSWLVGGPVQADVVVARDDHFATGGSPFTSLIDTGDGKAGVRVALSVPIPWFFFMGNERVGSSISIAVDPARSHVVYLAWGDGSHPGSTQTLHVRRSTDRGVTWSADLVSVANATNPAIAITHSGKRVGFMYQQVVTSGATQRWETHVQVSEDAWASPAEDFLLANTPVDNATHAFDPYIGDYADLQSVDNDFYGIFSAHNFPDLANFPYGVKYQRNANFATHQLLDLGGSTVANSIDPFFFHISWPEDKLFKHEESVPESEQIKVKGFRYERIEIDELSLASGDLEGADRHGQADRALARLGHRLERLGERLADLARHEEHHKP